MSISKKIFIISSVLLATVLFFMAIYNISFKKEVILEGSIDKEKNETKDKGVIEKIGEKVSLKKKDKIYKITDEAIVSPTIDKSGEKIVYFTKLNGSAFEISFDGEMKNLFDDNNFFGLESVLWNSEKNKVISRFNNNGKIEYSTYDYDQKKGYKLSENVEYVSWNNLENQIFYKYHDPKTKKSNMSVANFDGSNWRKIADLSNSNFWISSVPQSSFVSFWNTPNAFEETSLSVVSGVGGEAKKIFSGKFGTNYLWSSNGNKVLVSSSDMKGGSKVDLAVINSNGGEYQSLNIPTFVSKCVWSKDGKTIYYALPNIGSEGYVLPNDYMSKKVITKDTFWKVDITNGKKERIVDVNEIKDSYDASNLLLSPSEDYLFFINRSDGRLYGVSL